MQKKFIILPVVVAIVLGFITLIILQSKTKKIDKNIRVITYSGENRTYIDNQLKITFNYPTEWGELSKKKGDIPEKPSDPPPSYFVNINKTLGAPFILLADNGSEDRLGRGAGTLDIIRHIKNENVIKNWCKDVALSCEVKINKNGVKYVKYLQDTSSLFGSDDSNQVEPAYEWYYLIYNPHSIYHGLLFSTQKDLLSNNILMDEKTMDQIVGSLQLLKQDTVSFKVYFISEKKNEDLNDCGKTDWVMRTVPKTDNLAQAALEQLFLGPTTIEKTNGLKEFWINKDLSNYFNRVFVKGDTAYIDWKDIRKIIANASTSCGQAQFFNPISETLRQFPEIKHVVQAINGKTEVFEAWMQDSCYDEDLNEFSPDCDQTPYILNNQKYL